MFLNKCILVNFGEGDWTQTLESIKCIQMQANYFFVQTHFLRSLSVFCKLFTNLMARPALWCDLRPSLSRPKSLVTLEGCHIQGLILFSQPPLSSFQGSKKKKKSLGVMIQQLSLAGAVLQGHHDDNLSLEVHIHTQIFIFQSKLTTSEVVYGKEK